MAEKDCVSDEVSQEEVPTKDVKRLHKDSKVFCDPCFENGENITAERFCVECNDYLCAECLNVHNKLRATRGHMLKDIADMPVNKPVKVNALEICSEHKFEVVTHYCQSHDKVLCRLCKQIDHRNCTKVVTIDDLCLGSGNIEEIKQIKHQLESLQIEFKENKDIAGDNRSKAETYHQHVMKGVRAIRDKDLQMISAIENTCETVSPQITALVNDLDIPDNNKRVKLLMLLKAKTQTSILKVRLASVEKDNNISKYKFVPSTHSGDLGVIRKCPYKLDEIDVKTSSDEHDCWITDMERLSDNSLIIADRNNSKIKVINLSSKRVISQLKNGGIPWGVTKIDDSLIAVTTFDEKEIRIISTSDTSVQKTIKKHTFSQCRSIVCTNDTLTVGYQGPDLIEKLDLNGVVKQTIDYKNKQTLVEFGNKMYMTQNPNANIIYLSDHDMSMVHSFTMDGELLASFTHKCLQYPRGLTWDGKSRIFVCSFGFHNVFEISSDLSEGKMILEKKDGIIYPCSVLYDGEKDTLCVGSYNKNSIQLFIL